MKSLSPDSRSLIDEVKAKDAPPRGAELRNWQSLTTKLNAPLPPTAAAAHAAVSTPAAAGILAGVTGKVVVGIALAAASAGAGVYATRDWRGLSQPTGAQATVESLPQPSAAKTGADARREHASGADSEAAASHVQRRPTGPGAKGEGGLQQPTGTSLRAEAELIERAQKALAAGKPARALALLAQHRERFPNGALTEERAAARVLALCALGRSAEAVKEREVFDARWPTSMLAARVSAACDQPR